MVEKTNKPMCSAYCQYMTTIQANPARLELRGMKMGETHTCTFEIENTGNKPYVIMGLNSSCGCTVPTWSRQPVAPRRQNGNQGRNQTRINRFL